MVPSLALWTGCAPEQDAASLDLVATEPDADPLFPGRKDKVSAFSVEPDRDGLFAASWDGEVDVAGQKTSRLAVRPSWRGNEAKVAIARRGAGTAELELWICIFDTMHGETPLFSQSRHALCRRGLRPERIY
jgi:hypothetical protein